MSGRKGKVPSISMASVPNPRSRKWGTITTWINGDGMPVSAHFEGPMTKSEAEKYLERDKQSGWFLAGMVIWSQDWKGME
jgi:hypothetical protein